MRNRKIRFHFIKEINIYSIFDFADNKIIYKMIINYRAFKFGSKLFINLGIGIFLLIFLAFVAEYSKLYMPNLRQLIVLSFLVLPSLIFSYSIVYSFPNDTNKYTNQGLFVCFSVINYILMEILVISSMKYFVFSSPKGSYIVAGAVIGGIFELLLFSLFFKALNFISFIEIVIVLIGCFLSFGYNNLFIYGFALEEYRMIDSSFISSKGSVSYQGLISNCIWFATVGFTIYLLHKKMEFASKNG